MSAPRVPVQFAKGSLRLAAALKFAAGPSAGCTLSSGLAFVCAQLAILCDAPIASVYVLEGKDDLVLRGNHGFEAAVLGEVRLKVGQGITGTAVETMRPVSVDDAGLIEQFAYFPQLAEERYPVFLAVPILSGARTRGALVLQRQRGAFSPEDVLLAVSCTRALTALIEAEHPTNANLMFHGSANGCGRALGLAHVLTRAMPRRSREQQTVQGDLASAFAAEREELLELAERARVRLGSSPRVLDEICTVLDDARLLERAEEHLESGVLASVALERIAAETARALMHLGPASRRAVDVEAFLGAVAHRLAGLEPQRVRRGELLVGVHLSGLLALRGWAHEATGAVCAGEAEASTGVLLLTALGLPVVCGVRQIFEVVGPGDRLAIDGDSGEVLINPTSAQATAWRR